MINSKEFRFNLEHAILGKFTTLNGDADPLGPPAQLPFFNFIATRLLPCSEIDKPIEKFTGNDDVGSAPKDDMTEVLHAFSHYVMVYSCENLALCDLQGALEYSLNTSVTDTKTIQGCITSTR